ncbi:hypothetical protein GQ607_015520, partial [Colletotrichum asianum]
SRALRPPSTQPPSRPCPRHQSRSESHFTEEGSPISLRRLGLLPGSVGVCVCVCVPTCLPIYLPSRKQVTRPGRQASHPLNPPQRKNAIAIRYRLPVHTNPGRRGRGRGDLRESETGSGQSHGTGSPPALARPGPRTTKDRPLPSWLVVFISQNATTPYCVNNLVVAQTRVSFPS